MRQYYVYILSGSTGTLYIGVTNDLRRRVAQHKLGTNSGFAKRYHINKLVHFESTLDVRSALSREKQLKRWSRACKVRLIEKNNLGWRDLSIDW